MPRSRTPETKKRTKGTAKPTTSRTRADRAGLLTRAPAPPSDLPARAAVEWQALAPELVKLGVLRASDLRALRLLAETLADVAQARAAVVEHGLVATSAAGTLKPNPAVKVLENARAQATRLLAEFGLTPRGRENVTTRAPSTGRNPFSL